MSTFCWILVHQPISSLAFGCICIGIWYSTKHMTRDSDTQKPKVKNKKKAAIEAWCGSSYWGPNGLMKYWAFLVWENPFL